MCLSLALEVHASSGGSWTVQVLRICVWSPSKNSSNILWLVLHVHCLQPFNIREGDVLLTTTPSTIHLSVASEWAQAPSSVHMMLLGINAFALSVSLGHAPHPAGHGVLTNGVFVNTFLSCLFLLLSLASLETTCHMLT